MANLFFISDTHFSHENILSFKRQDGTSVRPFKTVEEMDETMVDNWNRVVRPQDHIYHLGDVLIKSEVLLGKIIRDEYGNPILTQESGKISKCQREPSILSRLNGHKRLVRGNHDIHRTKDYLKFFEEIYGLRVFPEHKIVLSHAPLWPGSVERWGRNVHGHLHERTIGYPYINVSVEQINYTPISLEELKIKMANEALTKVVDLTQEMKL